MVALKADACDCSNGYCREFCTPTTECVYRIARDGEVKTDWCVIHNSDTWHLNGKCLKCAATAKKEDSRDVNYLINVIAQIRQALGVGHKPMLSELSEEARKIRGGLDQYDKIREMGAIDFLSRWQACTNDDWSKFLSEL